MEGPSIHLAAEQLRPFVRQRIQTVSGNSKIGIERLRGTRVMTGDYRRSSLPRLMMAFRNGDLTIRSQFVSPLRRTCQQTRPRPSSPPELLLSFVSGDWIKALTIR
ncbi:MAG TPA: hypothetical protein VF456_30025 [Vicinamibacterales bacterium]